MCESASSLMPPSPSPEYKHFCRVCNKGFTCGSALGGHMRAHGASDVDAFGNAADDDDVSLGGDDRPAAAGARSSDDGGQWDAAAAAGTSSATHAYALRANPNRLIRSCQVCKNCGKEFTSWELFLEHGRCNSDDDDEDHPEYDGSSSPPSDVDGEDDPAVAAAGGGWSKGKRSRRVKLMNAAAGDVVADVPAATAPSSRRCASGEEEEDLANCLVMLSSSNVEHAAAAGAAGTSRPQAPSSASKEGDRGPPQLLPPISFLAPAPEPVMALPSATAATQYVTPAPRGLFECKACKKVFTSHQALGGHRASHKKVKGCFAARFDSNVSDTPSHMDPNNDNGKAAVAEAAASTHADANKSSVHGSSTVDGDTNAAGTSEPAATLSLALAPAAVHEPSPFPVVAAAAPSSSSKKNTKMHECSVCHRLFTSGQALGGHKRCHWLTTSSSADPGNPVANLAVPPLTEDLVGVVRHQLMLRPLSDPPEPALDLTIAHPVARAAAADHQPGTSSFHHLDAPPPVLHFQSPVVLDTTSLRNRTSTTSGHDGATASAAAAEDEADSTVAKKPKLSDLKAVVSMDGEAPEPWLKVGIGSSSAGGDDDKNTRE